MKNYTIMNGNMEVFSYKQTVMARVFFTGLGP